MGAPFISSTLDNAVNFSYVVILKVRSVQRPCCGPQKSQLWVSIDILQSVVQQDLASDESVLWTYAGRTSYKSVCWPASAPFYELCEAVCCSSTLHHSPLLCC